ncbi:apolipoprotein N-acyltransferase [Thalassiella azotivora]
MGGTAHRAAAPARWARVAGRLTAAVLAGLVLWAAFPPHDLWWAAPLAVGILTAVVAGRGAAAAFGYGLTAGLGLFVPLLSWTSNVGADAWLALALLQAVFLGAMATLVARLTGIRWWPIWVAAAWVAQEALRGRLPFGGFTWGRLAFSQADSPLLPYAAVGGTALVTFAAALLGGCVLVVAGQLLRRRWRAAGCWGAVGAAVLTGPVLLPGGPAPADTVTVAAVQGNVPRLGLGAFAQERAVLDNHAQATARLADDVAAGKVEAPDLVLWPENSSDVDPYRDPGAYARIDAAVRAAGVPTLVGAVVDAGPGRVANTGIVWDPVTGPGATYVKQHPVPFAEYVPFRSLLTRLDERFAMVPRDFVKGDRTGLLQVGPAAVGDVICFEVAYDGLVRTTVAAGAQFLVVQTNNATFGYSAETEQQLAMSRLRAVEHGRDVVVVATSGVSAVITPDGTVSQRAELFTAQTLTAPVGLRNGFTPGSRVGAGVEWVLSGLAVAPLLAALVRRPRRPRARRVPAAPA